MKALLNLHPNSLQKIHVFLEIFFLRKMFDSSRFKLKIFSTITFALIILITIFAGSIISNVSLHFKAFENGINHRNHLQIHQSARILKITSEYDPKLHKLPPQPEDLQLFDSSDSTRMFDSKVREFFSRENQCKVQVFMTWISSVDSFGEVQFFGLESLFQTNPSSCLIILSKSMDSDKGFKILAPLTSRGFRVRAMSPDLWYLLRNTPTERWFDEIKNGSRSWGEIPPAQNLSNLIRLAVLFKYGGVYLDTDFIILKDFSGLRNSIGAQSVDSNGNWTRLNNAVLVFDKNHPLVYSFLDEFASTFDGNKWGHNGPYLVSRVVAKTGGLNFNFTVLPPVAFYPVYWTKVAEFFVRPNHTGQAKWVEAKIQQINGASYGVHLWNRQSSGLDIEEGSIIERLISDHCVVCSNRYFSTS
ncbi:hypothetical protein ACS0TY_015778 [Phlomoides rotata]